MEVHTKQLYCFDRLTLPIHVSYFLELRMKKQIVLAIFSVFAATLPASAASISMESYASSAPNVFGSPSWPGYLSNAMTGLANGGATTGTAGQPTLYSSGTIFAPGDFIATGFNSWKGIENPGPPYEGENGNRLHFGVRVKGNGQQFALWDLNFDMHSNDAADSLAFSGNYNGSNYSERRFGIDYGLDGMLGGGDDTIYNSGQSGALLVDELFNVGVGNAFAAYDSNQLADALLYIAENQYFRLDNRYWLTDRLGNTLAETSTYAATGEDMAPVPEPTSMLLLGSGLLIGIRKRKKLGFKKH
jgi:hypothetical protein